MSGADVVLSPKRALALSMAIHELATNASKYGALSAPQGRVDVHWAMELRGEERWLTLHWSESGGPEVAVPSHQGFGTRLITEGLAFELNGDAAIDYRPGGVSCVINVPLSEVDGDGS
jgi:two-component system CheB/CheR fusion protein